MDKITLDQPIGWPDTRPRVEKQPGSEQNRGFGQMLKESIGEVAQTQHEANRAIESLVTGKSNDIHQTMIAMEKANISFRLLMQVRNKLLSAYQEIMRMQI